MQKKFACLICSACEDSEGGSGGGGRISCSRSLVVSSLFFGFAASFVSRNDLWSRSMRKVRLFQRTPTAGISSFRVSVFRAVLSVNLVVDLMLIWLWDSRFRCIQDAYWCCLWPRALRILFFPAIASQFSLSPYFLALYSSAWVKNRLCSHCRMFQGIRLLINCWNFLLTLDQFFCRGDIIIRLPNIAVGFSPWSSSVNDLTHAISPWQSAARIWERAWSLFGKLQARRRTRGLQMLRACDFYESYCSRNRLGQGNKLGTQLPWNWFFVSIQVVSMAKRLHEDERRWRSFLILLAVSCSCVVAYLCFSPLLQNYSASSSQALGAHAAVEVEDGGGCCRGLEHTELWSDAVNWGSDFLVDSTQECCEACKANQRCNSWVYCADQAKCGNFHRQVVPLIPYISRNCMVCVTLLGLFVHISICFWNLWICKHYCNP